MHSVAPQSREHVRMCARRLAAGVAVVTTCDPQGRPYGLTMSAVTSLSLDPALFLICVSEAADTLPVLLRRRAFASNVLRREQEALARIFAGKGGREKFYDVQCTRGVLPCLPVLADALAVIECEVIATHPGGDHRAVIGGVRAARAGAGEPLLHYAGGYRAVDRVEAVLSLLAPTRSAAASGLLAS